jgi:hypothetical protein
MKELKQIRDAIESLADSMDRAFSPRFPLATVPGASPQAGIDRAFSAKAYIPKIMIEMNRL